MIGLAYWDNGFKQMSANKKLVTPADYRGLKFRIQSSKVLEAQFRALGAVPQVMAFSEVYQALQTGVVEGRRTPGPTSTPRKCTRCRSTSPRPITAISATRGRQQEVLGWLAGDIRGSRQGDERSHRLRQRAVAKENEDALADIVKTGKSEIIKLTPEQDAAMRKAMEGSTRTLPAASASR